MIWFDYGGPQRRKEKNSAINTNAVVQTEGKPTCTSNFTWPWEYLDVEERVPSQSLSVVIVVVTRDSSSKSPRGGLYSLPNGFVRSSIALVDIAPRCRLLGK